MERLLSRCALLLLGVATVAHAASTPVATNPILTTITTTSTRLEVRTVSTSTSTTTPILCPDGTCIAISLVEIPILATSTILSVGTVVNTVGFTTIYSDIPDAAGSTPAPVQATPTPDPGTSVNNVPAATSGASQVSVSSVIATTNALGQPSFITVFSAADPTSGSVSSGTNSSNGGLETKYIAVIAVLAVVIGLAVIGVLAFFLVRRRRRNAAAAAAAGNAEDDASSGVEGRSELAAKTGSAVAELSAHEKQMGAELSATGDGYRGTAAPTTWSTGAPNTHSTMSELPGSGWGYPQNGNVYEAGGNTRYELR